MPSAVTEAATWESSVIGPVGSDIMSAQGVRDGLQDLANRTKWLKELFGNVQIATNNVSGVSYTAHTYDIANLTFANVKNGDVILCFAQASFRATAGTTVKTGLAIYDETNSAYVQMGFSSIPTAQFTALNTDEKPISLCVAKSMTADQASVKFRVDVSVAGGTPTVERTSGIYMVGLHLRKGQT